MNNKLKAVRFVSNSVIAVQAQNKNRISRIRHHVPVLNSKYITSWLLQHFDSESSLEIGHHFKKIIVVKQ